MTLSESPRSLLDVNVLVALLTRSHVHHRQVKDWFYAFADRPWAMCAFTEAGFLRNATAVRPGQISMTEATAVLRQLARHPGYRYIGLTSDWETLCSPFFTRLYGTKQVTDAYLLGLALRDELVLVTIDKAILHMAGDDYAEHVLLLKGS